MHPASVVLGLSYVSLTRQPGLVCFPLVQWKWGPLPNAHGRMQTKGVNYWETYLPIVSWTMVCLVLILSLIMGWHMRSLDFVMVRNIGSG